MKFYLFFLLSFFIYLNAGAQDLPFNIAPKNGTTLPTSIIPGQTTVAYYTISNTTPITSPIANNFVKYFPPNVTQLLTDATYTDICQTKFTLQPKGSVGDSCTLKLQISAPVQTNCSSTNPQQCLFICMSDRTTCGGTNYPLNLSTAVSTVVGFSIDTLGAYLPLTYRSTDGGAHWTIAATSIVDAPAGQDQGLLNAVACVKQNCSAIGYTFNNSSIFYPLSYTSSNNGTTWAASPNVTLPASPAGFTSAVFNQLSCRSSKCVVVGNFYFTGFSSPAEPIAYLSTNRGKNWNLSHEFPVPTPNKAQKDLWGVSCSGNMCAAVGQNNDLFSTAGLPLGYYSVDGGTDWNLSSSFTLPVGQTQGSLLSTNCQGSHCVAAGVSYINSIGISQFLDPLPLVYLSNDNGASWSAPVAISSAGGKTYGFLWGVTCNNATCVAVGQAYNNASTDSIPTSYVSSDGGANWTASLTGLSLPAGKTQALLYSVSCTNAYCIAVGQAYTTYGSDPIPTVYTSPNYGATWTLSDPLPLPSGTSAGSLIGVSSGT